MRSVLKFIGLLAVVCLLFIVVVSAAFYYLVREGEVRRFLISEIERKTELKLQLGDSDLEIGRILGIRFRDVAVSEPGGGEPAITAEGVTVRIALLPLLERKLIFYEIRLRRPSARLFQGKDGKMPLLERLVNLPFLKHNDAQFTLDLRAIRINGGEIGFSDYSAEGTLVTTRLHNVDLELDRMGGTALQELFQKFRSMKLPESRGAALNFELRTSVERDSKQAKVWAKGSMVFPGEQLEIQNVWWNAETRIADAPASLIQAYAGNRLALKSIGGTLNSQLHVEGTLTERLQVKGELAFKNLMADAPAIFSGPVTPGDGRLELDLNWQPQRWDLARVDLRSHELTFQSKCVLSWAKGNDPQVHLSLVTPFLSVAVVKKYLPAAWLYLPRIEGLLTAMQQGDLRLIQAGINSRFSEIGQIAKVGFDERLWFDAELRDVGANFSGGYLPILGIQGRMTLEKGLVSFKGLTGSYGQSRLTNISGTYRFAMAGQESLQLHAAGEVEMTELHEQLRQGFLQAKIARVASSIQDMAGRGKFDVAVSQTAEAMPQVEGKIMLDGARLQINNWSVSEIRGDLNLTPTEIKGEKLRALLSGSPVQIQLAVQNYTDDDGTFDLFVDSPGVKSGVITRLLLSTGSLQDPGTVRGSVRYQGRFATRAGRKFTGTLDLANVQLATLPLLQPLRELNGRVKIDETAIDFQNVRGLLVGFPANFSGRWRYAEKPHLVFDFVSADLDFTYLLSQIDPESSDFYANLQAEGKIALAKGQVKNLEFSDFRSDVIIDHRIWRLSNATVQSAGGSIEGVATIADKPDSLAFNVMPKIQAVPVSTFLKWFDISNTDMTGRVNLTGNLESIGKDAAERKKNLNGSFSLIIEDGTIHRLRILVQLLNLLDLSRWFTLKLPDLTKQGIRFRKVTGDFKVNDGVYSTENLVVDSDDLRMTGAGKIDVPKHEIDFIVAVRPFAGIDTAINYIPLIGRGIAAIKNSLLVASFNISGSIDNPTIVPAPLSTLSEWFLGVLGIPKNMLGLGADGKNKKDETANETVKEAPEESSSAQGP